MVEKRFEEIHVGEFGIDFPNLEIEVDGDLKVVRIFEVDSDGCP